jgi:hypothetical protein
LRLACMRGGVIGGGKVGRRLPALSAHEHVGRGGAGGAGCAAQRRSVQRAVRLGRARPVPRLVHPALAQLRGTLPLLFRRRLHVHPPAKPHQFYARLASPVAGPLFVSNMSATRAAFDCSRGPVRGPPIHAAFDCSRGPVRGPPIHAAFDCSHGPVRGPPIHGGRLCWASRVRRGGGSFVLATPPSIFSITLLDA